MEAQGRGCGRIAIRGSVLKGGVLEALRETPVGSKVRGALWAEPEQRGSRRPITCSIHHQGFGLSGGHKELGTESMAGGDERRGGLPKPPGLPDPEDTAASWVLPCFLSVFPPGPPSQHPRLPPQHPVACTPPCGSPFPPLMLHLRPQAQSQGPESQRWGSAATRCLLPAPGPGVCQQPGCLCLRLHHL